MTTLSLCLTLLSLAGSDAQPAPASPAPALVGAPVVTARAEHGKLNWFKGTYEELLAEGARSNKIMFLDFWTSW
jgi:hypothetical protein